MTPEQWTRLGVEVRVVLDSHAPMSVPGNPRRRPDRLLTVELRNVPTVFIAQVNTHGALSRSWQSARAKPTGLSLAQVRERPHMPPLWTTRAPGMQGGGEVEPQTTVMADALWLAVRDHAASTAEILSEQLRVAKQDANRLLTPWSRSDGVLTGTTAAWVNFLLVRATHRAQPAIEGLAKLILREWRRSMPRARKWHLPYIVGRVPMNLWTLKPTHYAHISAARCARVSYRLYDGTVSEAADEQLATDLLADHEVAPFGHPAVADTQRQREVPDPLASNLAWPWVQFRKLLPGEALAGHETLDAALDALDRIDAES